MKSSSIEIDGTHHMSKVEEVDQPPDPQAGSPEESPLPESRTSLGTIPHPTKQRSRLKRSGIWKAGVVAVLLVIIVTASLLGSVFLVDQHTGALAPTPTTPLGITVSPASVAVYPRQPVEAQRLEQALDAYISQMSLDDELGQMIQVQFVAPNASGLGGGQQLTIPADWLPELKRVHVGSAILYQYNIESINQLKAFTSSLQSSNIAPHIPLILSMDQEGGWVDYLWSLYGAAPSAADIGASGDPQQAYTWGKLDGQRLAAVGFNSDLAPVVDVQTTPDPNLGTRLFGSDPTLVTKMASAFIDGLHSQGIMDALKHWPGLGWASVDAHYDLPVSNRSLADLERIDFAPYKALLAAGKVDMIMPTHVLLTQIDPTMPSSLSPIIIDGILRHDLGYQGVLITDALYMGAIRARYSLPEAAVLAVIAGNDILCSFYTPSDLEQVMAALHQAINDGRITRARIDQSVKRILLLKMRYGLFTPPNYHG